jgi:beta-xylosidase
MRTAIVHRADAITGPWEGRVALRDKGVAQGGLIDTPDGKWYAYLFQDHGAVGRAPYLVPVNWEDGWPVLGLDGKAPMELDLPAGKQGESGASGIVASDEFDRKPGDRPLPLAWQWNHIPDDEHWSLSQRSGMLRLTTGRIDKELVEARNTLTQRTFGPQCAAETWIDASGMKDGDFAGICVLQKKYGFVGIKAGPDGNSVVMVGVQSDRPREVEAVPLDRDILHLRVECDFRDRTDKARFFYSGDGRNWKPIGNTLRMAYTLPHFMGYRFGLFNFATKDAGGCADFDYLRLSNDISGPSPVD